jgi:hypothetical protein
MFLKWSVRLDRVCVNEYHGCSMWLNQLDVLASGHRVLQTYIKVAAEGTNDGRTNRALSQVPEVSTREMDLKSKEV